MPRGLFGECRAFLCGSPSGGYGAGRRDFVQVGRVYGGVETAKRRMGDGAWGSGRKKSTFSAINGALRLEEYKYVSKASKGRFSNGMRNNRKGP